MSDPDFKECGSRDTVHGYPCGNILYNGRTACYLHDGSRPTTKRVLPPTPEGWAMLKQPHWASAGCWADNVAEDACRAGGDCTCSLT